MTEAEPGAAGPGAGEVGVHRQDVSEPVTEPESLNAVPQRRRTEGDEGDMDGDIHHDRGQTRTGDRDETSPDEMSKVRQEIEQTRDDLGDTIEALASKADVRARAQERMHELAERVREVTPQPVRGTAGKVSAQARKRPGAFAAAGAAATAVLVLRRMARARAARTARRAPAGRLSWMMRLTGGARTTRGMRIARYFAAMRERARAHR